MRQHEKYQTICDYTPTTSHNMGVVYDIKRYFSAMQKLKEIIAALLGGIKNPENSWFSGFSFWVLPQFYHKLNKE